MVPIRNLHCQIMSKTIICSLLFYLHLMVSKFDIFHHNNNFSLSMAFTLLFQIGVCKCVNFDKLHICYRSEQNA